MAANELTRNHVHRIAEDSARSSFFLIVGSILSTVISAVSTILIGRFLGPELYGQYALALAVPQLLFLFADIGINHGLIKFSASLRSKGETSQLIPLIKHGLVFKVLIGLIISAANFAFSGYFASYLLNRPDLEPYIRIASISIIFQVIATTATSSFVGLDKAQYNALTTNLQAIGKVVISLALVLLGLGVAGAVTGYVVGYLIASIAGIALLFAVLRGHAKKEAHFIQDLKTLTNYGLPLYVSVLLTGLVIPYQNLILGLFTSDADVGYFKAAANFLTLITVLSIPITTALLPAFSKLDSTTRSKIKDFFKLANKYTSLLILPSTLIMIVFSRDIVLIVYGSAFETASLYLSTQMILYFLVGIGYLTIASFFNGLGETRLVLRTTIVNFIIFLILTPILTQSYGALGLIAAFLASNTVGSAYGFFLARARFDVEFARMAIIKIYVASLASAIPALLLLYASPFPRLINVAAGAILYLLTYITIIPMLKAITFYELETLALILKGIKPLNKITKPLLDYEKRILEYVGQTPEEKTQRQSAS
jgi:O-antigen/teichoic acid export membrane protein